MMAAMTSAQAGINAHQTAMNVTGNNISNINTTAFKAGSTSFRDTMYQSVGAGSASNSASGIAGTNPSQVGYGAAASGVSLDTTKGGENATGKSSDVYIDGDGYLAVADGAITDGTPGSGITPTKAYSLSDNDSVKYTRIGELKFDSDGYLTDGNGKYILGQQNIGTGTTVSYSPAADGTTKLYPAGTDKLSTIKYNPKNGKLSDVKIGSDGTITASASVSGSTSTVTIGKIALANFTNASGLTQAGNGYYKTSLNSGDPTYSAPGDNATGTLITGAVEASNTDIAKEFSNMIVYERGYQANTKIISVCDEMLQSLVNMK